MMQPHRVCILYGGAPYSRPRRQVTPPQGRRSRTNLFGTGVRPVRRSHSGRAVMGGGLNAQTTQEQATPQCKLGIYTKPTVTCRTTTTYFGGNEFYTPRAHPIRLPAPSFVSRPTCSVSFLAHFSCFRHRLFQRRTLVIEVMAEHGCRCAIACTRRWSKAERSTWNVSRVFPRCLSSWRQQGTM